MRWIVSLHPSPGRRPARLATALAAGSIALAALLLAGAGVASTPPSSTLTVPSSPGQTVTATWTGTIPAGANPTSSCAGFETLSDRHEVTIQVPPGTYDVVDAAFRFTIEWADATNDEILTVLDPEGEEVGSSDGGTSVETVTANSLPAGTYSVLACPFLAAVPVTYTGRIEITTSARTTETSLPSAPAQGLAFSAAVAADNQRDEAEPLLEIDKAGNVYDCGPTGSSNFADYAQVSPVIQGGDQFHLLGNPPRGQQSAGGGGDCALAFGTEKNSRGNYQYAYTGLGPLTGFATSTSPNNGRSLATGGPHAAGSTDEGGGADRQWMTFVGAQEVLVIYNQQVPRNVVVQRSTDGGLTYSPFAERAARNPRFPGPIRYIEPGPGLPNGLVYFPWDRAAPTGNQINISFSTDRGLHWRNCGGAIAPGTATPFVTADHDSAGNIYLVYGENARFHTYLISTSAEKLTGASPACPDPAATTNLPPLRTDLFTAPVQVDRDAVRTSVFQWVTAGGAPGRVAVVFAGTETDGNPNVGTFKASWHIYVNQSLNANAPDATFSQVKATTHPFHYDSICLNGLACDLSVPPGDRSMADFFSLDYNPVDKRLYVTFNRSNKKPDEAVGHVASPMVVAQIAGPSLGGGTVSVPDRAPLRSSSVDRTGDALSSYSTLAPAVVPPDPPTANEPAADFTSVTVGPEVDLIDGSPVPDGGFTVTMRVADLSTSSLTGTLARTGSQSLLWVWRFTNGYQDAAASARWNPVQGFTFGFNDYTVGATPCLSGGSQASEKCILYPGGQPIPGQVDQATGTIRLSVPRFLLRALSGPEGPGQRPAEVPATVGSRLYDGTAFSLGNTVSPFQDVQSFLYPLDNTPSMDFLLPAPGGGGMGGASCKITGSGTLDGGGKFSLNVHAGTPPKGSVAYRDSSTDFVSTSIASATCSDPSHAEIRGAGKNRNDSVTFVLGAVDAGEPSTSDAVTLTLTPGGTRSGRVTRGNIQIHTP
ncbi:MAG TPA: hypothetical protein VNJ46_05145 [Gaiellaceae bacterium]|nr:hypothetical protein [Gaiellaceae bacterium]